MREIASLALKLFLFTFVSGALISGTNMLTKDTLEHREHEAAHQARMAVFPAADDFEPIELAEGAAVAEAYWAMRGGETLGIVVKAAGKGFGGDISVMVGVDAASGIITGVRVLSHNETPGLGDKAEDAQFRDQYDGRALAPLTVVKYGAGEGEINAISAATITSKGVTDAVNMAVEYALDITGR